MGCITPKGRHYITGHLFIFLIMGMEFQIS